MKRLGWIAVIATLFWLEPAHATCANGFTIYVSGQVPDITFRAGVPQTIRFNPWYASFNSNSFSCGIFARVTTPGVSVQQSYGCPGSGCPVIPPGEWAAVGDAYSGPINAVFHKDTDIPLIFDGSAPAGAQGILEIAVRDNDLGIPSQVVVATGNVYVESATPPLTSFLVGSTAANISGDRVLLDHPWLNGNPGQNLFVAHLRNPGGSIFGTSWNHPLAVEYDPFAGRWAIRNSDGVAMPAGLAFQVRVDPSAQLYCTSGFPGNYAEILVLHPAANGNIFASVLVTPIAGGPHPVAVRYLAPYWRILYSDGATIPQSTCFNVQVFAFTQYLDDPSSGDLSGKANTAANWGTGVDMGGFGTGHQSGASRSLMFDWGLENPYRQMMLTYNATPMGFTAAYDPRSFGFTAPNPFGLGGRWTVYHEDGTTMPLNARFNLWATCAGPVWYPDGDHDGAGVGVEGVASCAPLAGYAARNGDCDDGDGAVYPGAPEINDGQDNQCPGDAGYGQVDEVGGLAVFTDATTFCWSAQTGAGSYQVARSSARSFAGCSTLVSTAETCASDATVPAIRQVFHYLVRAQAPYAGSWGVNSGGAERLLTCP